MLNIDFFTFNAFDENTYLLSNEKNECWIIDPGMYTPQETELLISFITKKGLQPKAIINTHAHIDHIFGVQTLMDRYKIPFGVHEQEVQVLSIGPASAIAFGFDFGRAPAPSFFIKEGEPLQLGDDTLQVFHTPGHSPGSIAFYYPKGNWVVSGDTLFAGSIGRTDLPGGNFDALIAGIRKHLLTLPGHTTVYSGHGPATTIADEKRDNPFLR